MVLSLWCHSAQGEELDQFGECVVFLQAVGFSVGATGCVDISSS